MVQQIEQTAKRWKALQAIGHVTYIAAAVWGFVVLYGDPSPSGPLDLALWGPYALFGTGAILLAVGVVGAWWYHG